MSQEPRPDAGATMEWTEEDEKLSAEVHKVYCRAYEKRFGKPYWTNGDYSKLDKETQEYDRAFVLWHKLYSGKIRAELLAVREELAKRDLLLKVFRGECDAAELVIGEQEKEKEFIRQGGFNAYNHMVKLYRESEARCAELEAKQKWSYERAIMFEKSSLSIESELEARKKELEAARKEIEELKRK